MELMFSGNLSSWFVYAAIIFVSWLMYSQIIKPLTSPLRKIPHRPFRFLLGQWPDIIREEASAPYIRWLKEFGCSVFGYYTYLGRLRLLIADADVMKHVLINNCRNYVKPPIIMKRITEMIGNGLLTSEGESHLWQRKLCNPSFRISVLKNFIPVFDVKARELAKIWFKQVADSNDEAVAEICVEDDLIRMTLDMIGRCGFGYEFDSLANPNTETVSAFKTLMSFIGLSWKLLIPFYEKFPTKDKQNWDRSMAIIDNTIWSVIEKKRKEISEQKEGCYRDLLSVLVLAQDENGLGLNDKELRDEVNTFMLAGHETTSVALTWCLYNAALYPECQKKLREEVRKVLPDRDQPITYELLDQLPYLTCFIKETLRLYPPAAMTFRQAQGDDQCKNISIPKGTILNLNIFTLHRNPEYWNDPESFCPERFEDESKLQPYSYLPFIVGPRMCIGHKFAMLEAQVALACIIRELEFSHVPGRSYKRKQRITMRPNPSLVLRVKLST